MCEEHDVDAERFVELWMAFSLSNLNGASPTVENLQAFERKEFSKRAGRVPPAGEGTLIDKVHDAPRPTQYPFVIHVANDYLTYIVLLSSFNVR